MTKFAKKISISDKQTQPRDRELLFTTWKRIKLQYLFDSIT